MVGVCDTVPTNTVPIPMTTGTVTDSGSVCTGFIRGDKRIYIQDRWIVSAGRLTVRMAGMLAWPTRDPCVGGGGEVQVSSVESCGQPDAGWRAATALSSDYWEYSITLYRQATSHHLSPTVPIPVRLQHLFCQTTVGWCPYSADCVCNCRLCYNRCISFYLTPWVCTGTVHLVAMFKISCTLTRIEIRCLRPSPVVIGTR